MRPQINTLAHQYSVPHWKLDKLVPTTRTCSERETAYDNFTTYNGKHIFAEPITLNNARCKGPEK